jgi:hypothetical protein
MAGTSAVAVGPTPRIGLWRSLFAMVVSPASVLTPALGGTTAVRALAISGLAFVLLFLQTARDVRAGGVETVALVFGGFALGTLGVALVAVVAWVLALPLGVGRPLGWTVRAFGLAYSPVLIYSSIGMLVSWAVGWQTAVAFGASGLLWSLRPMMVAIQGMTGGRAWVSIFLTTLCGGFLLAVWVLVGLAS